MSGIEIDIDSNTTSARIDLSKINDGLDKIVNNANRVGASLQKSLDGNFSSLNNTIRAQNKAFTKAGKEGKKSYDGIGHSVSATDRKISKMGRTGTVSSKALQGGVKGVTASVVLLRTAVVAAVGAIAALGGITILARSADSLTKISNRLKLVEEGTFNLAVRQQQLYDISKRTRASFEASTTTFQNFSYALDDVVGKGTADALNYVEILNKMAALSGSAPEALRAGFIQFNQGLASGTLRGEELNSIMEQIPILARAFRTELGLNAGSLRKFAEEGGITADVILEVLEASKAMVDLEFSKAIVTNGQALDRLREAGTRFFAIFSSVTGIGDRATARLIKMADGVDYFTDVLNTGSISGSAGEYIDAITNMSAATYTFQKVVDNGLANSISDLYKTYNTFSDVKDTFGGAIAAYDNKGIESRKLELDLISKINKAGGSEEKNPLGNLFEKSEPTGMERLLGAYRLFAEIGNTVIVTFKNIGRAVGDVSGPIVSLGVSIQANLIKALSKSASEITMFSYKTSGAVDSLTEFLSVFKVGQARERAFVGLFRSDSIRDFTERLSKLNDLRSENYRQNDWVSRLADSSSAIRKSVRPINEVLISLGLVDRKLIYFTGINSRRFEVMSDVIIGSLDRLYKAFLRPTMVAGIGKIAAALVVVQDTFFSVFSQSTAEKVASGFVGIISHVFSTTSFAGAAGGFLSNILDSAGDVGANALAAVKVAAVTIFRFVSTLFSEILTEDNLSALRRSLNAFIATTINMIAATLSSAGETILVILKKIMLAVASFAGSVASSVTSNIVPAFEYMKSLFSKIVDQSYRLDKAGDIVRRFTQDIKDSFFDAYDTVVGNSTWPDLIDGVIAYADNLSVAINPINAFTIDVKRKFKELMTYVGSAELFAPVISLFSRLADSNILGSSLSAVLSSFGAEIIGALSVFYGGGWLRNVGLLFQVGNFSVIISTIASTLKELMTSGLGEPIGEFMKLAIEGAYTAIELFAANAPEIISTALGELYAPLGFLSRAFTDLGLGLVAAIATAGAFMKVGPLGIFSKLFGKRHKGDLDDKDKAIKSSSEGTLSPLLSPFDRQTREVGKKSVATQAKYGLLSGVAFASAYLFEIGTIGPLLAGLLFGNAAITGSANNFKTSPLGKVAGGIGDVLVGSFRKLGGRTDNLVPTFVNSIAKDTKSSKLAQAFTAFGDNFGDMRRNTMLNLSKFRKGDVSFSDLIFGGINTRATARNRNAFAGSFANLKKEISASIKPIAATVANVFNTTKSVVANFVGYLATAGTGLYSFFLRSLSSLRGFAIGAASAMSGTIGKAIAGIAVLVLSLASGSANAATIDLGFSSSADVMSDSIGGLVATVLSLGVALRLASVGFKAYKNASKAADARFESFQSSPENIDRRKQFLKDSTNDSFTRRIANGESTNKANKRSERDGKRASKKNIAGERSRFNRTDRGGLLGFIDQFNSEFKKSYGTAALKKKMDTIERRTKKAGDRFRKAKVSFAQASNLAGVATGLGGDKDNFRKVWGSRFAYLGKGVKSLGRGAASAGAAVASTYTNMNSGLKSLAKKGAAGLLIGVLGSVLLGKGTTLNDRISEVYDFARSIVGLQASTDFGIENAAFGGLPYKEVAGVDLQFAEEKSKIDFTKLSKGATKAITDRISAFGEELALIEDSIAENGGKIFDFQTRRVTQIQEGISTVLGTIAGTDAAVTGDIKQLIDRASKAAQDVGDANSDRRILFRAAQDPNAGVFLKMLSGIIGIEDATLRMANKEEKGRLQEFFNKDTFWESLNNLGGSRPYEIQLTPGFMNEVLSRGGANASNDDLRTIARNLYDENINRPEKSRIPNSRFSPLSNLPKAPEVKDDGLSTFVKRFDLQGFMVDRQMSSMLQSLIDPLSEALDTSTKRADVSDELAFILGDSLRTNNPVDKTAPVISKAISAELNQSLLNYRSAESNRAALDGQLQAADGDKDIEESIKLKYGAVVSKLQTAELEVTRAVQRALKDIARSQAVGDFKSIEVEIDKLAKLAGVDTTKTTFSGDNRSQFDAFAIAFDNVQTKIKENFGSETEEADRLAESARFVGVMTDINSRALASTDRALTDLITKTIGSMGVTADQISESIKINGRRSVDNLFYEFQKAQTFEVNKTSANTEEDLIAKRENAFNNLASVLNLTYNRATLNTGLESIGAAKIDPYVLANTNAEGISGLLTAVSNIKSLILAGANLSNSESPSEKANRSASIAAGILAIENIKAPKAILDLPRNTRADQLRFLEKSGAEVSAILDSAVTITNAANKKAAVMSAKVAVELANLSGNGIVEANIRLSDASKMAEGSLDTQSNSDISSRAESRGFDISKFTSEQSEAVRSAIIQFEDAKKRAKELTTEGGIAEFSALKRSLFDLRNIYAELSERSIADIESIGDAMTSLSDFDINAYADKFENLRLAQLQINSEDTVIEPLIAAKATAALRIYENKLKDILNTSEEASLVSANSLFGLDIDADQFSSIRYGLRDAMSNAAGYFKQLLADASNSGVISKNLSRNMKEASASLSFLNIQAELTGAMDAIEFGGLAESFDRLTEVVSNATLSDMAGISRNVREDTSKELARQDTLTRLVSEGNLTPVLLKQVNSLLSSGGEDGVSQAIKAIETSLGAQAEALLAIIAPISAETAAQNELNNTLSGLNVNLASLVEVMRETAGISSANKVGGPESVGKDGVAGKLNNKLFKGLESLSSGVGEVGKIDVPINIDLAKVLKGPSSFNANSPTDSLSTSLAEQQILRATEARKSEKETGFFNKQLLSTNRDFLSQIEYALSGTQVSFDLEALVRGSSEADDGTNAENLVKAANVYASTLYASQKAVGVDKERALRDLGDAERAVQRLLRVASFSFDEMARLAGEELSRNTISSIRKNIRSAGDITNGVGLKEIIDNIILDFNQQVANSLIDGFLDKIVGEDGALSFIFESIGETVNGWGQDVGSLVIDVFKTIGGWIMQGLQSLTDATGGGSGNIFGLLLQGASALSGAFAAPAVNAGIDDLFNTPGMFATGGPVFGAGTGTSDSIPAMLSNGEYVINAKQTNKHRGLLSAINSGGKIPKFATGGLVGAVDRPANIPLSRMAGNSGTTVVNLSVTGDVTRQTRTEIMRMIPQIANGVNSKNRERRT
jgi:tape measure domain-containing protein